MKVLHLYAGNLYGGIETMLVTIARHRDAVAGMTHEFGVCFPGRLRDELSKSGAIVHDLGAVRFSRPWTVSAARRRLAALLRSGAFDAVITHACWPHAVFAKIVRRAPGVRLVNWVHDALRGDHWIERRAAATSPDLVIANSRFSALKVSSIFPAVSTTVIHCPVERRQAERSESLRAKLGASSNTVVLLMASRLEAWKGHAVLLDAVSKLPQSIDWLVWIAGGVQRHSEQTYLAELNARTVALGIADRVKFLGQRRDIADLMAAADLYCQPNTGPEPFGVVLVEALDAGLPVVTSNFGGGAEVVSQECGVLVPPGDSQQLSVELASLVSDPDRRKRLGAAGRARAEQLCDPASRVFELGEAVRSLSVGVLT